MCIKYSYSCLLSPFVFLGQYQEVCVYVECREEDKVKDNSGHFQKGDPEVHEGSEPPLRVLD